jgi:hypothetical protein
MIVKITKLGNWILIKENDLDTKEKVTSEIELTFGVKPSVSSSVSMNPVLLITTKRAHTQNEINETNLECCIITNTYMFVRLDKYLPFDTQ